MVKTGGLMLKNVPKELRLIMNLLGSVNIKTDLCTQSVLFSDVDWDLFLQLTNHHRIYPLLYKRLKSLGSDSIPPFVIERLSRDYKKNTFQMLHLSGEMENLSHLFFNKNVRSLYLKGPVLAHDLYGDVSLRTSSDLDLLISISDLEIVDEMLIGEGYEKDEYIESILNDWKWRHHHFTYFHPLKRIKVEVHWRLNPGPSREPRFNDLWNRKRNSKLSGAPVYLLSKEDMFLFLASHGARHGWSRLRWLEDVKQLMESELDWEKVKELLNDFHFLNVGEQSMVLASNLLNAKVPEGFPKFHSHSINLAQQAIFYFENMVNLHTEPVPEYVAKYHQRHLFSLMSFQQKIIFLISLLHPYPEDFETLPLPKHLHFLYYPLRPYLWGWRKLKSVLPQRGPAI